MVKMRRSSTGTSILFLVGAVLILSMTFSAFWQLTECPISYPVSNTTWRYSLLLPNATDLPLVQPLPNLQKNDFSRLIDLDNFTFTMNHPDVCTGLEPLLLVLVHSDPQNVSKRKSIRRTWGSLVSNRFKLLFLVGVPVRKKLQDLLDEENLSTKDLVQGNFIDAYRNLTYKHVMAFKWTIYFCPNAKYLLKTDDDVFVNTPALLNYINRNLSPFGARGLMLCWGQYSVKVQRTWRSKWKVLFSEYESAFYPPYCWGFITLYSPDVVFNLYVQAQSSKYFWIDDAHLTGFMAAKANHSPFYLHSSFLSQSDLQKIRMNENVSDAFLFGPPNLKISDIIVLWKFYFCQKYVPKKENEHYSCR